MTIHHSKHVLSETVTSQQTKKAKTMTTHAHKPKTVTSTESAPATAAEPFATAASPATLPVHPSIAATPATAPPNGASAGSVTFLTAPPPDAHSPSPPAGYEPPTGVNYRGVLPMGTEMAAIPAALRDLARFALTYAAVLGSTAPPVDHLIEGLTVAGGWTGLRVESSAWDVYCSTEEGMAWQALRPLLDKLGAAFKLATDSDKSLASQFPGLATLLGAKTVKAQKAASTKRLNNKAVAEGKPPVHGAVGKKRQRTAEKAAAAKLAEAGAAPAPATSVGAAAPAASGAGNGGHAGS